MSILRRNKFRIDELSGLNPARMQCDRCAKPSCTINGGRPASRGTGTLLVTPEVGGLHHHYDRQAA